jgi:hypothetical protein
MSTSKLAVFLPLVLGLALAAAAGAADVPSPGAVITLASVEKVLGGKFKGEAIEPTVLFYSEEGGAYRVVEVYVYPAQSRGWLSDMKAQFLQEGEPIEDIPGLELAMFRPQRGEAVMTVGADGEIPIVVSVTVRNAASAEATRKAAVDLLKNASIKP